MKIFLKNGMRAVAVMLLLSSCCSIAVAQKVALKTNLIYDAALTVNLGAEAKINDKWTADLSANFNSWSLDNGKRWKHWLIQPEARYWLCDVFAGHFFGVHALGGQYNIGHVDLGSFKFLGTDFSHLKDHRYQGWMAGAGVAYGYSWILSKHFNLEAEIGVGWIYTRFDTFECAGCGKKISKNRHHNYVGPTKAALNLVYVF
ncbi:MAG: DUF3575 domain-containing protein [Muribaculaceae bacterium]|nr:DUF3575 domain-containing protein [Muribaculaceae bacterium]